MILLYSYTPLVLSLCLSLSLSLSFSLSFSLSLSLFLSVSLFLSLSLFLSVFLSASNHIFPIFLSLLFLFLHFSAPTMSYSLLLTFQPIDNTSHKHKKARQKALKMYQLHEKYVVMKLNGTAYCIRGGVCVPAFAIVLLGP